MDIDKKTLFVISNRDKFPEESFISIKSRLSSCDEDKLDLINVMQFKNPIVSIILSVFIGSLGADRFYIGDTGLAVLKLLTCGGVGIWTIIDWFLIMGATRERNLKKLISVL